PNAAMDTLSSSRTLAMLNRIFGSILELLIAEHRILELQPVSAAMTQRLLAAALLADCLDHRLPALAVAAVDSDTVTGFCDSFGSGPHPWRSEPDSAGSHIRQFTTDLRLTPNGNRERYKTASKAPG